MEFDVLCEQEVEVDVIEETPRKRRKEDEKKMKKRPPVVCVMGHVIMVRLPFWTLSVIQT